MKPCFACLILSLLCLGCKSSPPKPTLDDTMRSYIGAHYRDLVANWGPPSNVIKDGSGQIWTYYQRREWTSPGQSYTTSTGRGNTYGQYHGSSIFGPGGYSGDTRLNGQSYTTYSPPQTHGYTATRTFFIDKDGLIYRYSWRGK